MYCKDQVEEHFKILFYTEETIEEAMSQN